MDAKSYDRLFNFRHAFDSEATVLLFGIVVAVLAAIEIWMTAPPRLTASR